MCNTNMFQVDTYCNTSTRYEGRKTVKIDPKKFQNDMISSSMSLFRHLYAYVKQSASGSSGPEMLSHDRLAKRRTSSAIENTNGWNFFSRAVKSNAGGRTSSRGMGWKKNSIRFTLSNCASKRAN